MEVAPATRYRKRLAGHGLALVSSGELACFTRPRLFADVTLAAPRAELWHLIASDDDHAFWTLLGSGRAHVAGNLQRLFEELPSDRPLVSTRTRGQIRSITDPHSLGHLRVAAWKEMQT